MGPHEVVNGANGSVTWCQGPPFCPLCNSARAIPFGTAHILDVATSHCPGCRCHQPIQQVIPIGTYRGGMI